MTRRRVPFNVIGLTDDRTWNGPVWDPRRLRPRPISIRVKRRPPVIEAVPHVTVLLDNMQKFLSVFFFLFFFFFSSFSTANCPESAATLHLHPTRLKHIPALFITSAHKKPFVFRNGPFPFVRFAFISSPRCSSLNHLILFDPPETTSPSYPFSLRCVCVCVCGITPG